MLSHLARADPSLRGLFVYTLAIGLAGNSKVGGLHLAYWRILRRRVRMLITYAQ